MEKHYRQEALAIGSRLRALRRRAGLSQEALADRVATSRTNLARVERGKHMPTLDIVLRCCAALEVQPSEVLGVLDSAAQPQVTWKEARHG